MQLIAPNGEVITLAHPLAHIFSFQLQHIEGGVGTGTDFAPERFLSVDNTDDTLADFCPLQEKEGQKSCRQGFNAQEYNQFFNIKVNYHYNGVANLMTKKDLPENLLQTGPYKLRICTNDPTQTTADTCPAGTTAFDFTITRLPQKPPRPIIKMAFEDSSGLDDYRVLVDPVMMDLRYTCVSNEDSPDPYDCLPSDVANERYYFVFKWEMSESPTPLREETWLTLVGDMGAGSWNAFDPSDNPTIEGSVEPRADFTAYMITPVVYSDDDHINPDYNPECATDEVAVCGTEPTRPNIDPEKDMTEDEVNEVWMYVLQKSRFLLCKQKQCFEHKSRFYKINVSAKVIDRKTDQESEEVSVDILPSIIPRARVMVQLTWKQGLQSESSIDGDEGVAVDLDVHLIKKTSLETGAGLEAYGEIGFMCTEHAPSDGTCTKDNCKKHDDCNNSDNGFTTDRYISNSWNSQLDIDNRWGGGNYENPETIGLLDVGCYTEEGSCDLTHNDDDYLVVVTYFSCADKDISDGDACEPGGDANLVDVEVKIFIDGAAAPRIGIRESDSAVDSVQETSLKFKIKPNQWKIVAEVDWDGESAKRQGKKYNGDAVVTDTLSTTYPLCTWESSYCFSNLVPVWGTPTEADGVISYRDFVTTGGDAAIGTCE